MKAALIAVVAAVLAHQLWVRVVTSRGGAEMILQRVLSAIAAHPDRAVWATADLPFAKRLRSSRKIFRQEYEQYTSAHRLPLYQASDHFIIDDTWAPDWDAIWIKIHGNELPSLTQFPETSSILRSLPNVRSAMFSRLNAGGVIPPHRGLTSIVHRYMLALIIPPVRANAETLSQFVMDNDQEIHSHDWRSDDESAVDFLFDDTFPHGAENTTPHARVVLIVEVERVDIRDDVWYARPLYRLLIFLSSFNEGVLRFVKDATTSTERAEMKS